MPITPQEAWDATDPSHTEEQREASASAIMAGVAANDAYISSRSELEQLVLLARGGQVVAHADLTSPEEVTGETPTELAARTVDSTAVTLTPAEAAAAVSPTGSKVDATASGSPSPDNPVAEVSTLREQNDKLRAQLESAGRTPEV